MGLMSTTINMMVLGRGQARENLPRHPLEKPCMV